MSGTPGLQPRSGMISLDLPKGTVRPVPGGVDDHHVTVVYLGPDIDDAAFAKACLRARDAAAGMNGPLTGSVAGAASFPPSGSSDGKRPAFAPVRLPGAKALRSKLEDLSASEHKNWVPHVTLAYIGKGDPLPPAVPRTPVRFTHLSVHRGGDVKRFPLGGGSEHSGSGPAVELSAQTARLAITPAPAGKPGGPGLYHVRGMSLPPYFQQVRNALIRSGHTPADAYRITWGAIRRWAHGGGKVHPEVVAAAQAALADLAAKSARAHAHSNRDGDAVDLSGDLGEAMAASWLELALVAPGGGGGGKTAAPAATKGLPTAAQVNIATGATGPRAKSGGGGKKQQGGGGGSSGSLHPHVPAGSPAGGQFAKKGSGSSSSGSAGKAAAAKKAAPKKTAAKGSAAKAPAGKSAPPKTAAKTPAKTPAKAKQPGKATAPKMTGKPVPKATSRQQALQQRAGLLKQAAGDRAKVKAVNAQIASLTTAIHAAVKAAAAQKAAAANKKSATATAATAVKKAATTAAATTAASTSKAATTTTAKATATVAQMRATRSTLRARVVTLKAHAAGLEKQAAAIKLSSGEDDGSMRFLEMAFAEALTERVPPGKAEGGQFHARTSLTRHDTPEEAARAVNAMSEQQRAMVRARILPPPGFEWARGDRLAAAS